MIRTSAALVLLASLSASASPAAAAQWSDRGEYDLVLTIRSEGSPQKRLDLIDRWKKQYPKSPLAESRRELALATYQSMRDWQGMLGVAREINVAEPKNPVGLYWCASLIPGSPNPSPEMITTAESSAKALLAASIVLFGSDKKPAQANEAEWKASRISTEVIAHRALGWVAWHHQDFANAAGEFADALKQDPRNAEMSAWMGIVLALQKGRQPESIWFLTRAGSLRDEGGLPDEQRMQIAQTAERAYISYHGSTDGLDALRTSVMASIAPPRDFTIETAGSVALRHLEEQARPNNPELADWYHLRRMLEDPGGDQFFATLQKQPLPKLKGTVIRCSPDTRPEQVTLGIKDSVSEEVVLKFDAPMRYAAEAGTEIEFTGAPESFHKAPFQLVITADSKSIDGWPTRPPSRRK